MNPQAYCLKCGALLTSHGSQEFCPACLFAQAASDSSRPEDLASVEDNGLTKTPSPAGGPDQPVVPSLFGNYEILEQIGEGGFGVVFMAEQVEPIRRKVALKIVKPGMDTKQVVARFEAERQALALMDHPNIAHVFDAGATETGRPYFVMELVHGVPITKFCDENDLTPEDRLKLFMTVCEAVQHAHQKGIIHRDLKPSNILVTLQDGKPVPKVIDFGTAKALQQPLTDKTLFTSYGKFIGTPQYTSPEQAELNGVDVDTRSDIYSLGVLLYELLTGTTPFEVERLRSAAFEEMMRIIREEEPPRPSTRVSTLDERVTEIAKHRRVDATLLRRVLRGDLDWIVMKALEKDRTRRYETASGLLADIRRHLNHQPVSAGPPGASYRARKFIRRHRIGVALVASVAIALIAGLILSLIGFAKARRERDRAVAAEEQVTRERDHALAAEKRQLETLDSFLRRSVEDSEMISLLEEGAHMALERLGPTNETYIRSIEQLADRYGSAGDWIKALELFLKLVKLRPNDLDPRWSAHVAALAVGKIEISRELSAGMPARFGNSQNEWVLDKAAYMPLLSSDRLDDLKPAEELAIRALSMDPKKPVVPTGQRSRCLSNVELHRDGNAPGAGSKRSLPRPSLCGDLLYGHGSTLSGCN